MVNGVPSVRSTSRLPLTVSTTGIDGVGVGDTAGVGDASVAVGGAVGGEDTMNVAEGAAVGDVVGSLVISGNGKPVMMYIST